MKKSILMLALALCLAACSNQNEISNEISEDFVSVTFQITGMQISVEKTRANTVADAFAMLDLVLYQVNQDGTYTKYKECSQSNTAPSFGLVTFENVKCGNYKLVALGHDDTSHPDMDDPTDIAFTKYTNLYGNTSDITIAKTSTSFSIPFDHKAAKLQFDLDGYIPEEVEKIKFTIDGASNTYNAITGFASSTTTRIANVNVTEAHRTDKKISIGTFTLLTQDELSSTNSYLNVGIAGLNSSNQEIGAKTYNKVPLKIGYTTNFSGVFFDYSNISFSFTINTDWGTWDTVDL